MDNQWTDMTLNQYQKDAHASAVYQTVEYIKSIPNGDVLYLTLGLVGEAGEFADKIKKIVRNKNGEVNLIDREELIKELGDVLWYLSELSRAMACELEYVARQNLNKLSSRKERGVIASEGDNR